MGDPLYCPWCGYPVTLEEDMSVDGEQVFFRDGKTGEILEECPNCAVCLELAELLRELPAIEESGTPQGEGM